MSFNYSKLRGKIREVYSTQSAFAFAVGMSTVSLSHKLNNMKEFTQKDIEKTIDALEIPKEEIPQYFFTLEVQEVEQTN